MLGRTMNSENKNSKSISVWCLFELFLPGITIYFPMILNLFKKEYSELGVVEDSNSSM